MNEHSSDAQPAAPSVGEALRNARQQLKLSQQDIAQQLNVRLMVVEGLEQDDYSQLGSALFVKGYIKAYAKVVQLDAEPLLAQLGALKSEQKPLTMQSFSKRTEREAKDSRLMLITYFVLAVFIGLIAWVAIQSSGKLTQADASSSLPMSIPVSTELAAPASQVEASTPNHAAVNEPDATETAMPASDVSGQDDSGLTDASDLTSAQQPTLSGQAGLNDTPTASSDVTTTQSQVLVPEIVTEVSDTKPVDTTASIAAATDAATVAGELVLNFVADCWVEIHDANGERLAVGLKKAGYRMPLSGAAPYKLVLGQASAVKLEYQGQAVDISHMPENKVARFTIPLAE